MTAGQHWGENWDYSASSGKGPSEWPKHYNAGEHQSPINILIDYRDLQQSRCDNCTNCKSTATNQTSKQQQYQHQISRQFKNLLNLNKSSNNNNNSSSRSNHQSSKCNETHLRRDHLDSVGNDLNESDTDLNNCLNYPNGNGGGGGDNNLKISNSTADNNNSKLSTATFAWQRVAGAASRHIGSKQQQQQQQQQKHLAHMQTTRYCATNKKIFLGYPRYLNTLKLTNTGHAWQADLASELATHTLLCGPPLADREYRLAQFHCHWGEDCTSGSEHQVNGQSYSAEIHFVHWNCSQFRSLEEASRHKHGLAVLGVLVQALEGDQHKNKHLDKIIQGVGAIERQAPASTTLENTKLDLKKLFPANRWDYATYEGSLTTPPLSEVVDWIVFLQPIQCSASQIDQFRRLRCPTGPLLTNCRPVQELNKRTVSIWTHSNHSHTKQQD